MTIHVHAPGRVNLIGEHTDHTGGLVLPMAIDRGVTLMARRAVGITLRTTSSDIVASLTLDPIDGTAVGRRTGWTRYVAAVVDELATMGRPAVGLDGTITSDLPTGAGLSSSAALEVAVALALVEVADFDMEPLALAQACQRAEQAAVGVPCGVMDQAASILGRRGQAVLLDCHTLDIRYVPVPSDLAVVVINSGITRRLEDTPYAQRLLELQQGVAALAGRRPADVDLAELDTLTSAMEDLPARRLRHVVTENRRVRDFVVALGEAALDPHVLGRILDASHASLRDDLEVSVPGVDRIVASARHHGAHGARLTGAGFGGSVIALVPAEHADRIGAAVVVDAVVRSRGVTAMTAVASAGAAVRGP